MPPSSIAYIYKSLGCVHSLQPDLSSSDGQYSTPNIPALKAQGFVTWQTIQLLLGPDEHAPYIQQALRVFHVVDPEDGSPFPTPLPRDAFPLRPDEKMVQWHEGVSERLRAEAQREIEQSQQAQAQAGRIEVRHRARPSSASSQEGTGDERSDAARYFSNPWVYRNKEGRPQVARTFSKGPGKVFQGGKAVAVTARNTVKNIIDPHLWSGQAPEYRRRRSLAEMEPRDAGLPPAALPMRHLQAPSHFRHSSSQGPREGRLPHDEHDRRHAHFERVPVRDSPRGERPPRRMRDLSSSESDEPPDPRYRSTRRPANSPSAYRRHRSQETPTSSRGYFDDWERSPRRTSVNSSAFVSPQLTPSGSIPQPTYGRRPAHSRSPMAHAPRRYSAEDDEYQRAQQQQQQQSRQQEASRGFSSSTLPLANASSPPTNPVASTNQLRPVSIPHAAHVGQRTMQQHAEREELRPTRDASSRPASQQSPTSHAEDAVGAEKQGSGNTTESSSPSDDGDGDESENKPPRRQNTGTSTPRQGTPVAGVKGRRYATEVPWTTDASPAAGRRV